MLLTLLAPFLGMLGSLLPSIVRIFERKQEIKYELDLAKINVQSENYRADVQYDIEALKAAAIERQSLLDHDKSLDGGKFLNALRASIRPVITYIFFAAFIIIKACVIYVMIGQDASMTEMLAAVWDQDTMALFGAVMGFWFGSRVMEKRDRWDSVIASTPTTIALSKSVVNPVVTKGKKPAGTGRDK